MKLVILTEGQLTSPLSGKRTKAKPKKETSAREALRSYEDLSPGDLVVHVHHGIGRFAGIERMRVDGVDKDYIKICYAGNDSLYVPATQLDMVSKYIGGHGDLLGGAVISNDEQFLRECRLGTLMHFGSVMAPFTAFLVCRGLKTLGVRMKQYNESALKIAKWLEANPKIETVRYPFLESNPQYTIAKKQMKGGGGMISFDVAGGLEAGKKFINSLKLCTLAVSLGDTETLVEQAAAMTHTMIPKEIREAAGITDGMIRMSVGLEDPDDIIADLKQALGD